MHLLTLACAVAVLHQAQEQAAVQEPTITVPVQPNGGMVKHEVAAVEDTGIEWEDDEGDPAAPQAGLVPVKAEVKQECKNGTAEDEDIDWDD